MANRDGQVALLALLRVKGVNWHFIAREAQRPEGLDRLLAGRCTEGSEEARKSIDLLADHAHELHEHRRVVAEMLKQTAIAALA